MTPWGEMLRVAARAGVTPAAFWRLSLKEWRMLTERPAGPVPMGRDGFERMMAAWPDEVCEGAYPSTASWSPSPSLRDGEET
tara:strand:+ start:513 stop:758 length:246 start_codon:yes stop_codon:yes gene_type:complete